MEPRDRATAALCPLVFLLPFPVNSCKPLRRVPIIAGPEAPELTLQPARPALRVSALFLATHYCSNCTTGSESCTHWQRGEPIRFLTPFFFLV
jgi:hypothetical protein